jgi:hypothetical protein
MKLRVECYAGRKADERPVRFQLGERDNIVDEIVEQWMAISTFSAAGRPRPERSGACCLAFDLEPDFQGDLEFLDFAVHDSSALTDDLEPIHVTHGG